MNQRNKRYLGITVTGAVLMLIIGASPGCNGAAEPAGAGAAIMELTWPAALGALERAPVTFDHGKHTKALGKAPGKLEKDLCLTCHPRIKEGGKDGALSLKFARTEDGTDRDALMNTYHDTCIGCHAKREPTQGKELPQTCGACHVKRAPAVKSRWRALTFDRSIHRRHELATDKSCKTCHHVYDKKKKALVYQKGDEAACKACHGAADQGKTPSLRRAAHTSCLGCHQQRAEGGKRAGPRTCAGCHDAEQQGKLMKLKDPPRLVTKQKDRILIRTKGAKIPAVAFDHKLHDQLPDHFCTTCHHTTVKACGTCHTRKGHNDGGGVTLQTAHHASASKHSCVGCHAAVLEEKRCAGCHHALGEPPGRRSCATCHAGPAGKIAASQPASDGSVPPAPRRRSPMVLPPSSDDFPERVKIASLASEYQPSDFPHRKVVAHLLKDIGDSKLAAAFHGRIEVLCSGCHHHQGERGEKPSSAGARPPACKSCHGAAASATRDRPSLKAAYHRQCIGCHKKMGLKPDTCTTCHASAKPGAKPGAEVKK